jgi:hypothetical protein
MALDQIRQQESVFGPQCMRLKQPTLDRHAGTPDGETGRIQVSDAAVCLQQLILESCEAQVFGFANQRRAVSDQTELKAIMLRRGSGLRCQGRETVWLQPAVRVHKQQSRPFGKLNAVISGSRNSGVSLSNDGQREAPDPLKNDFRGLFVAAVVDNNDFGIRAITLLC